MSAPTPPAGSPAVADQAAYDALQDARLRQLRRPVAVAVAGAVLALCVALAGLLRPRASAPSQSPTPAVVHVTAPACPPSPPCPACAACPACPAPTERHHR